MRLKSNNAAKLGFIDHLTAVASGSGPKPDSAVKDDRRELRPAAPTPIIRDCHKAADGGQSSRFATRVNAS
jgi:hypothetical protein